MTRTGPATGARNEARLHVLYAVGLFMARCVQTIESRPCGPVALLGAYSLPEFAQFTQFDPKFDQFEAVGARFDPGTGADVATVSSPNGSIDSLSPRRIYGTSS